MIRLTIGSTEVAFNPDRFLPSRQLIRQQLDSGKLGEVGLVRVHRWEPNVPHEINGLPTGLLRDLDLVLWLVGKFPDSIHAVSRLKSNAAGSRLIQVHLGFPGGAMALIDYSNQLPEGDGYQSLSVIGSTGAAYADDHQNTQLVFRGGRPQAVRAEETGRRHTTAVQERIESLQAGRDVPSAVADWQRVVELANTVARSHATNALRLAASLCGAQRGQARLRRSWCHLTSAIPTRGCRR